MRHLTFLLLIISFLAAPALAQDDVFQIMQKSFNRNDGSDSYFKLQMSLIDKKNEKRERKLEIYTKDYGALIKTFIQFIEPADINKTRFLTWENDEGDDTQYLYLPALGRARRIVSSQKNLRFVNTDFTYEDMQRRRPEKDEHKLLRQEKLKKWNCYVIESTPKDKSQYSKRVSWVEKQSLVVVKTEFFNKRGEISKVFIVEQLEQKQGIWSAIETLMEDLKQGHKTVMKAEEVIYNQGLDDGLFSLRRLEQE